MHFFEADEYQPRVSKLYQQYKDKIHQLLPDAHIEHVGASSIPGAVSKGDLDIYVGVEPSQLENCIPQIELLGFQIKQNTLRTPNLCMLEAQDPDLDVAIQLVGKGSSFEKFLHFRDRIRGNPELLAEYNKMKRSCAGLSMEEYRSTKQRFIERVLTGD